MTTEEWLALEAEWRELWEVEGIDCRTAYDPEPGLLIDHWEETRPIYVNGNRVRCPVCRGPAVPSSRNRLSSTHVEGLRCYAYSPGTMEEYSADAGDYWHLPDGEPLHDAEDKPMILAVKETRHLDALTGEEI